MNDAREIVKGTNWCIDDELLVDIIKAVQLDAWKQGMTDAADVCERNEYNSMASCIDFERDNKKNI